MVAEVPRYHSRRSGASRPSKRHGRGRPVKGLPLWVWSPEFWDTTARQSSVLGAIGELGVETRERARSDMRPTQMPELTLDEKFFLAYDGVRYYGDWPFSGSVCGAY